jgi:hypothetical protein
MSTAKYRPAGPPPTISILKASFARASLLITPGLR